MSGLEISGIRDTFHLSFLFDQNRWHLLLFYCFFQSINQSVRYSCNTRSHRASEYVCRLCDWLPAESKYSCQAFITRGSRGYITLCIVKDIQCLTVLYRDTLLPLEPPYFLVQSLFSLHFEINSWTENAAARLQPLLSDIMIVVLSTSFSTLDCIKSA